MTDKPPTPLQFATSRWLAALREAGICLQNTPGTLVQRRPARAKVLELTIRFVRELDAEEQLEKLGAQHCADLELQGTVDYEVVELASDGGTGVVIGSGRTPAEAVRDAELVLSP